MTDIADARILILATDGFEQSELFVPRRALIDLGVEVVLASIGTRPIQGMEHDQRGEKISPDLRLDEVDTDNYDGLLIPGGVANPDRMRTERRAVEIVAEFVESGRVVAAICHGPWLLAEADVLDGRRVTCWPSLRTDLENAGAEVVDMAVVVDDNLITSRKPEDIPAFNDALIKALTAQMAAELE